MKFPILTISTLLVALSGLASADDKTCNANAECAALQLADDCCPTSLAGIFLDCCEDPETSCAANAGCGGLEEECCPTQDGTFLYCCFEGDPSGAGYRNEYTYFGGGDATGTYLTSTGSFVNKGAEPTELLEYKRSEESLFDLIYVEGAVPDAGAYVTGEKKFYMTVNSETAPPCTQVMLQFDSLPASQGDNYPAGRHSRYLGTITPNQTRIEFNFLDRPDEGVLDTDVNAIVILFDPGSNSGDTYNFGMLDSHGACESGDGCEAAPTKSCPALYVQIAGADAAERKLQDEFTPDCSDCRNPACMNVGDCSLRESHDALETDPNFQEVTAAPTLATAGGEADTEDEGAAEPDIEAEMPEVATDPIANDPDPESEELETTAPGVADMVASSSSFGPKMSMMLAGSAICSLFF